MTERFARLGVPPDRVHHVPLGVSAWLPQSANEDSIPADARGFAGFLGLKVVYVGSLVSNKSVDTLLEAHRLASERGTDVACLIVGTGPTEPQLRRMVSESRTNRVVFVGEKSPDRVASYVRLADVLVLPSRAEGLGLVLVQAMMLGVAVIASDISGPRELIEDGVTGLLFPPGSSEQLAGKLAWLAASPKAARDLGERGRHAMEAQRRTLESSAASHHVIYARLADLGGGREPA
jgi:glycosyltransferase involved in cell wall biosynthesis